uniref:Uncharacterized protein n=1 Tax=Anguilla anguilla TaxID=7936 RepID=A0A0E9QE64_ANGAN
MCGVAMQCDFMYDVMLYYGVIVMQCFVLLGDVLWCAAVYDVMGCGLLSARAQGSGFGTASFPLFQI